MTEVTKNCRFTSQKSGIFTTFNIITITFLILQLLANPREGHCSEVKGAKKILFYSLIGFSHRQSIEPLSHRLADKGHEVTFFGCEKAIRPHPLIAQFCPQDLQTFADSLSADFMKSMLTWRLYHPNLMLNVWSPIPLGVYFELQVCNAVFSSPDTLPWIQAQHKFDLVIGDTTIQKCAYALAHKFNASFISFLPHTLVGHEGEIWGFPGDKSWAPSIGVPNYFEKERSFSDRFYQVVIPLLNRAVVRWIVIPRLDGTLRKILELPNMPSIKELEEQTNLVFVNIHPSDDLPRSLPPFVIPIGGMHCDLWDERAEEMRPQIPRLIEEFIHGAGDDGFVFVSFGSIAAQMSFFPEEVIARFFEAIRGRKTRFLWKWDVEPPKNIPENVMTARWFPQQSLLAHRKIKGFISHGGLMSYQQASCYGVPTISIPINFDQPYNAHNLHFIHEAGIRLEISKMTAQNLSQAIDSILHDKRYLENAKRVQKQFLDRPLSPIDLAEYWTEYVMRHPNNSYMKPTLAMRQFWWQRQQLDVWLFIVGVTILSLWLGQKFIRRWL